MKIVIAMDSFKGTLPAVDACAIAAAAIRAVAPRADIVVKPMADGGEGTASALMAAAGGQWVEREVMGPLPEMRVNAGYVRLPVVGGGGAAGLPAGETAYGAHPACPFGQTANGVAPVAVVEMATASGLHLLRPEQLNPLKTTTFGTGELIQVALASGAEKILLTIGGSATVDGGVGAAMALGWQFRDDQGRDIEFGGGALSRIVQIIPPEREILASVEVLCDVDNPLCGPHGAAAVYGPQKGATPAMVEVLDAGLAHLAVLVKEQLGRDVKNVPGAGAAGGLAAGALAFMNARLVSGIDEVMAQSHLKETLADADWVVTGEGRFDVQSLRGKVVSGVTRLARQAGARVAVLAGQVLLLPEVYRAAGIEVALSCMTEGMNLQYALDNSEALLTRAGEEFARGYLQC